MANIFKKIFIKNLDNVENQDYFTEGLKTNEKKLDSTLYVDGEKLTIRKKESKKDILPKGNKLVNDSDSFIKEHDEKENHIEKIVTEKKENKEEIKTSNPDEKREIKLDNHEEKNIKEVPIIKEVKEEKNQVLDDNLVIKEPVKEVEEPQIIKENDSPKKEDVPEKIEPIKDIKEEINQSIKDEIDKPIIIDSKEIERKLRELEDLAYDYSDKIFKSEEQKEIDYYIKELYRILDKINSLIKELNDNRELLKIDEKQISNKEEFLVNYEYLSNKLEKLQNEYVNKEIEAANIKLELVIDSDKEKDKKMLEVDRQAKEAEYFQKKIDNDLKYLMSFKKNIEQIEGTRERVTRTYVGVRRAMNNLSRGLMVAAAMPGILGLVALAFSSIRATMQLAGEMVNPTYIENRYQETVVTEEVVSITSDIDDSEIYNAEKDLDEIIKDFDYIMKECYKMFNEDPKYKDLFDELKNIKYMLDSQKQELIDMQKTTSKQLVLEREPIN